MDVEIRANSLLNSLDDLIASAIPPITRAAKAASSFATYSAAVDNGSAIFLAVWSNLAKSLSIVPITPESSFLPPKIISTVFCKSAMREPYFNV